MRTAERAEKSHFFLSLRLLGSPWNSERSRQPGEERRRRGEPLTQGRARERGGPGASGVFVCGRDAGALCPAGPSPGARRAPAGARTARRAAPAPAASLAPARVLAAPRSQPRLRPEPGPAPDPPGPHLLRRRARGGDRPWAAGGGCLPGAPGSLLPQAPGPLRRAVPGRSARSVDRPSLTQPSRRQPHLEGRGLAFSESNPAPRGSLPFLPGSTLPRILHHLWSLSSLLPGGGDPLELCPRGMGRREAECFCARPKPWPLYRVRPALMQRPEAGAPGRRRGQPGLGGAGEGTPPKVEGAPIARAPVQSLAPGL